MTVVDYFLLLPDKTLENSAARLLGNAQVIDRQNGYISIAGDGAQLSFQVALFRYRDLAGRDSSRFAPVNLKGTIRSPWTFSSSERTQDAQSISKSFSDRRQVEFWRTRIKI